MALRRFEPAGHLAQTPAAGELRRSVRAGCRPHWEVDRGRLTRQLGHPSRVYGLTDGPGAGCSTTRTWHTPSSIASLSAAAYFCWTARPCAPSTSDLTTPSPPRHCMDRPESPEPTVVIPHGINSMCQTFPVRAWLDTGFADHYTVSLRPHSEWAAGRPTFNIGMMARPAVYPAHLRRMRGVNLDTAHR